MWLRIVVNLKICLTAMLHAASYSVGIPLLFFSTFNRRKFYIIYIFLLGHLRGAEVMLGWIMEDSTQLDIMLWALRLLSFVMSMGTEGDRTLLGQMCTQLSVEHVARLASYGTKGNQWHRYPAVILKHCFWHTAYVGTRSMEEEEAMKKSLGLVRNNAAFLLHGMALHSAETRRQVWSTSHLLSRYHGISTINVWLFAQLGNVLCMCVCGLILSDNRI